MELPDSTLPGMSLNINTNLASLDAQHSQTRTQGDLASAIARLSSGLRINSAADDAAGLAIADRFTSQIRGSTQAGRNANDAISLAQTADGALASISDNLQRIRELSVQSANATNSSSDRASLQLEVTQLQSEIDRVATQTLFNGSRLLDGSFGSQAFQVGANVGQTVNLPALASSRTSALGLSQGFSTIVLSTDMLVSVNSGPAVSITSAQQDAKGLAAAINQGVVAGLTATANATVLAAGTSAASATVAGTATLTLNGVAIGLAGGAGSGALAANRTSAVTAINAQSAATGVVAVDTGSGVSLSAADGRDITLAYTAGSFASSLPADFGLASAALTAATVNLQYVAPPGTTGSVFIGNSYSSGNYQIASIGTAVGAIDITTASGAAAALASIDLALNTVDAQRAQLGAVQSRFSSAIGNLQSSGENLSASRSRVEDADFAVETAKLSRAQVLQQAETAMVAQANQSSGEILTLLR